MLVTVSMPIQTTSALFPLRALTMSGACCSTGTSSATVALRTVICFSRMLYYRLVTFLSSSTVSLPNTGALRVLLLTPGRPRLP